MTQDEIKKALDICTDIYAPCNGCPYEKCTNCDNTLHTDALNVIIEQEKEIERLRTTLGQFNTELNSALESLKSQCREIGELKAGVKQVQIDALNNVKDVLVNQKHECLERNNLTGYSAICDCEKYIYYLIKEVQDGKDKG